MQLTSAAVFEYGVLCRGCLTCTRVCKGCVSCTEVKANVERLRAVHTLLGFFSVDDCAIFGQRQLTLLAQSVLLMNKLNGRKSGSPFALLKSQHTR